MYVNLMRSHSRWLMIVISALVIISFVMYYNRTSNDRFVSDKVGTIYGRALTSTEFDRVLRRLRAAHDLELTNITDPALFGSGDAAEVVANHLVMQHRADELGLMPSGDEVADAEQKLPVFQGADGKFDGQKFAQFVNDKLSPSGFGDVELEDLIRTNIRFGKLRELIDAGVVTSPAEIKATYDTEYAKTDASVVRFKSASYAAAVNPTDDEIKKSFEDNKDKYQAPEKRKIQYVVFGLDDAQKKIYGKPRMDALKPKADAAAAFLEKLYDNKGKSDFATVAKEAGLTVKETVDFEETQRAGFPEATVSGFALAAFKLTQKDPDSDVPLQVPSGQMPEAYYVLHLADVTPSRPLTLDEAKSKVVEAFKAEHAKTALNAKAVEVRTKIEAALKEGKSFNDAAKEAGESAQDVPDFSLAEPDFAATADSSAISDASTDLGAGELSKFVATPDGGFLLYVRGRKAVDPEKFEKEKDRVVTGMETQKKRFFFFEWLRSSREAANANLSPSVNMRG